MIRLREFRAIVESLDMDCVVMDRIAFHPRGGGLVSGVGVMKSDVGESRVIEAVFGTMVLFTELRGELQLQALLLNVCLTGIDAAG
ncbi:MAG: hypothetical protein QXF97_08060 [Candidatus Caldarchaeum sp.]